MIINNPKEFFEKLGNLHDARVERFEWIPDKKYMFVTIDDINSNFVDLPEYQGHQPAKIMLTDVSKININLDPTETHLNIYDFVVENSTDNSLVVEIKCWPGGDMKINCASVSLAER